MKTQLQELMEKELSRKEFFTTVGLGIASVFGFATVIRMMSGKQAAGKQVSAGYGASAYGK